MLKVQNFQLHHDLEIDLKNGFWNFNQVVSCLGS